MICWYCGSRMGDADCPKCQRPRSLQEERRTVMTCENARCDNCGRFLDFTKGTSSAAIYDFVAMECLYEAARCPKCTDKLGPVHSNARPANGDMRPYETIHT